MANWLDKYEEMRRWRTRIADLRLENDRTRYNAALYDHLNAFFSACLHLRDWLNNDPAHPIPTGAASHAVNGSHALSLCHDIVIGTKHLRVDTPKVDPAARVSVDTVARAFGPIQVAGTFAEVVGTQEMDALRLADDCIAAWEGFLKNRGLPPASSD